jgi:hypothetical protein
MLVKLKEKDLNPTHSNLEKDKGNKIIDAKPRDTITTAKVQPKESEEIQEGECLFHSHMCVKGTTLHFFIDSRR